MRRLSGFALSLLLCGIATIALAVVAFPAATGTKVITIDRGSMGATLPAGSLAYVLPQTEYKAGEVVTYTDAFNNVVTHRLIAMLPNPANADMDGTLWQTKGDANLSADEEPLPRKQIIGTVTYHIPWAGTLYKTLKAPPVIAFLVLVALGLWWLSTEPSRTQRRLRDIQRARQASMNRHRETA